MIPLVWWPATRAQRERIFAAATQSACGCSTTPSPAGDRFVLVCRGHDLPATDLDAGRTAGGIPTETVAEWIATFLAANQRHLAVFEDVVHSPGDPAIAARSRACWELPHDVAWPMFAGEDAAAVVDALSMHRGGTRTILLFRMPSKWQPPDDGAMLTEDQLQTLRGSVCALMSDAYDHDAWLIWNRHVSVLPGIVVEGDAEPGVAPDREDR